MIHLSWKDFLLNLDFRSLQAAAGKEKKEKVFRKLEGRKEKKEGGSMLRVSLSPSLTYSMPNILEYDSFNEQKALNFKRKVSVISSFLPFLIRLRS
jgi:hypothetical protein